MLAEFIKFLVSLGEEKVLSLVVKGQAATDRDRVWVKSGLTEIVPEESRLNVRRSFGSIADFADGVKKFGEPASALVFVNSTGAVCVLNPDCIERQAVALEFKPYYSALPSAAAAFDFPGFIELLDAFTGKVVEETSLRQILKVIKVQKKSEATLEDKGGFVRVSFGESEDVETANQVDIPKYITFRGIPFFDPSYVDIDLKYRLMVSLDKGLQFRITPMPDLDERHLKATNKALEDLRGMVGGEVGFPVYRASEQRNG